MKTNNQNVYLKNRASKKIKAKNTSNEYLNFGLQNLTPREQVFFRRFGFGPKVELPFNCIHYAFESYAKAMPDGIAVSHLEEAITYKELNYQANKLAGVLIKNGVKNGDNVGLFLKRSIPMVIGIFAILKAGAAYVPQHISVVPEEQLKHVLKMASIKVVLTVSNYKNQIPTVNSSKPIFIDEVSRKPYSVPANTEALFTPEVPVKSEDKAFIIFTSGTTGSANGVQVSHLNICNILLTAPGNLGMRPGLKVGQILNIAFDMAVWEILGCLANGASLVIRGKDIQETAEQVDVIISTPTILSTLDTDKCKNVKVVAVAGEPCPEYLANQWSKFCAFYNSCGPTETTIVNTAQRYYPSDQFLTIGRPTPNNTVYILDKNMQPCAIGDIGEMWAGGDCVSIGYINNEELNSERYVPDPFLGNGRKMFRTRDLGRWTVNGELEHFGRVDDQVKIKGFRVELDSVSNVLESIPICKRAVALKYDSKTLVAFVSPETITEDQAKDTVLKALPYYCVPERIIALKELPKTSRGKINKRLLMEMAKNQLEKNMMETINKEISKDVVSTPSHRVTEVYVNYEEVVLPPKQPFYKRIWKHPFLMQYNRLIALIAIVNISALVYGITSGNWWSSDGIALKTISNITIINIASAILIRQQYVVNLLFKIATSVPVSWPLTIRWAAAKVYHFGGIHMGGNIAGTIWFSIFVGSVVYCWVNNLSGVSLPLVWVTSGIVVILIVMVIMALPKNRAKHHNRFELTHRFGGWAALVLFWVQTLLFVGLQKGTLNYSEALTTSLGFWLLLLITISIAIPWMYLKKVAIQVVNPSSHVVLVNFNYGVTPFAGSSTSISRNPLREWHSFANVPAPGKEGFRLTISRAGDWTGALIDDLPSHVWVKGIPTAGVGNIEKLFKRVVWIATGSGIGPCIPHLLANEVPSILVWATRNPRKTYGDDLVDEILDVQPNAIIWNTDSHGKPDMVKLAYKAYKEFNAEAVICISNKKLTWQVVHGMEIHGIPAYGAIWDS